MKKGTLSYGGAQSAAGEFLLLEAVPNTVATAAAAICVCYALSFHRCIALRLTARCCGRCTGGVERLLKRILLEVKIVI
jgi:hypothetical protein